MLPTTIKFKYSDSRGIKNKVLYIHPDDIEEFEKNKNKILNWFFRKCLFSKGK